jgi:fructose-bisphosphate aldolase class II
MTYSRLTVTELLRQVASYQAVCAFNVENFDTLLPALKAAADLSAPVVIALTVPAARYLGFEFAVELVDLTARRFGTTYALHLDHCEDADDLRGAIRAGFTSANFLNEGVLADDTYLRTAVALRDQYDRKDVSLEFIIGTLGHHDGPHPAQLTVDEIVAFAQACRPDVIGFHCGSLHGMRDRCQDIDTPLIAQVATATRLPIVLHGSSGVRQHQLLAGIDAGIRKINIETAIRAIFTDTVKKAVSSNGPAAHKPRYLTMATDEALDAAYRGYLNAYTLRAAR